MKTVFVINAVPFTLTAYMLGAFTSREKAEAFVTSKEDTENGYFVVDGNIYCDLYITEVEVIE